MKVDFSAPINGFDGRQIEADGPLTLGRVVATALNNVQGDATTAMQRGVLALRVYDAGEIDVSPEEAALARSALPTTWAPIVVAQAHQLLG